MCKNNYTINTKVKFIAKEGFQKFFRNNKLFDNQRESVRTPNYFF